MKEKAMWCPWPGDSLPSVTCFSSSSLPSSRSFTVLPSFMGVAVSSPSHRHQHQHPSLAASTCAFNSQLALLCQCKQICAEKLFAVGHLLLHLFIALERPALQWPALLWQRRYAHRGRPVEPLLAEALCPLGMACRTLIGRGLVPNETDL